MDAASVAMDRLVRRIIRNSDISFGAKNLNPLIVTIDRPPAVIDDADGPVHITQGYHRRINIAGLANRRINQDATAGEKLLHLPVDQIAGHVKIVDGHIEENAPGNLDILKRWGGRVPAGNRNQVRLADLSGGHPRPYLL